MSLQICKICEKSCKLLLCECVFFVTIIIKYYQSDNYSLLSLYGEFRVYGKNQRQLCKLFVPRGDELPSA